MTQDDRFFPLTLKKDRAIGFKLDIERLYALVIPLQNNHDLKVQDFNEKWIQSKMNIIYKCIDQTEEPDQYYHLLYQTILKKFMSPENAKVFSLYLLLFVYWSSIPKIKINVNPSFINCVRQLLSESSFLSNAQAVAAVKSLYPLLSFEARTGVKSLQLRENGEPVKRIVVPEVQIQELRQQSMLDIKDLSDTVAKYQKLKKRHKDLTVDLNKTNKTIIDSVQNLLQKIKTKQANHQ